MASILDKKIINDDRKFLIMLVVLGIFVLWFFSSIDRRSLQVKMISNNIRYYSAKFLNNASYQEYLYHPLFLQVFISPK